jgi:hypothetical protein
MQIDPTKFIVDEEYSNLMVAAMRYPNCLRKEICAYIVIGSTVIIKQCEYFRINDKNLAECLY